MRVMLPVFCLTSLSLGIVYMVTDPDSIALSPSWTVPARMMGGVHGWGVYFTVVGIGMSCATFALRNRKWTEYMLAVAGFAYLFFAGCFAWAAFTVPDALATAPIYSGFIALVHFAAMLSLTDRVVTAEELVGEEP
jgi:predicted acyltransferase